MMNEEKTYKLENNEELNTTCKAIAERWTEFYQDYLEKERLDGYKVVNQAKYDEWWKQYTDETANDIRGWINDDYEIAFDGDELPETDEWGDEIEYGDADDLEDDVYDNMRGKNGGNGYEDGYELSYHRGIVEVLEKAGLIRKINSLSEKEIKNATWTVRDNNTDGNLPTDGSQCVYKLFEATICGHKYGVEYSEDYGYVMYVDGEKTWDMEDTTEGDNPYTVFEDGMWCGSNLAEFVGEIIGERLDALDPELEEMAWQAEQERSAED